MVGSPLHIPKIGNWPSEERDSPFKCAIDTNEASRKPWQYLTISEWLIIILLPEAEEKMAAQLKPRSWAPETDLGQRSLFRHTGHWTEGKRCVPSNEARGKLECVSLGTVISQEPGDSHNSTAPQNTRLSELWSCENQMTRESTVPQNKMSCLNQDIWGVWLCPPLPLAPFPVWAPHGHQVWRPISVNKRDQSRLYRARRAYAVEAL